MRDLQEKAVKLLETLQKGQFTVEIDASSGTAYINGIEFTIPEQQQFMEKYGEVPTFETLFLEQKLAQAEKKIAELAKQLQSTEQEKLSEKDLKFPQHFKKVDKNTSKVVTIDDVQKIIDELKELEVPYGSFVLVRVGNVAVLKIHDDQGISYLVTTDFYQAHLG